MKNVSKKTAFTALIIFLSIAVCAVAALIYFRNHSDKSKNEYGFTDITLEDFEEYVHKSEKTKGKTVFIYIGRDDCPDCKELSPKLQKINKSQNLNLLYYSTSQDRKERPDKMYAFLDEIKVDEVPMILELSNGKIAASYSGEDFLSLYAE